MHVFSFEKLDVWKEAIKLAFRTYYTTDLFPSEEKFGLTSQMRRCSVSVSSNSAKGTARLTSKDKAHFMTLAYSSTIEFQMKIIKKLGQILNLLRIKQIF